VLTLPLLNPWVRGDGVGYYAFARAPLIQHNFDFTADYQHANESFRENRFGPDGKPRPEMVTRTGHLENHFSAGPAILWSPFLIAAHAAVLAARALGSPVSADGFSSPYRLAMAFATALYGFLALWIAFRLARRYAGATPALLAALGIWGGSSLAMYMYFNPSWSHALSAFTVAVFLWYWHRTRERRTLPQWCWLGVLAGLMLNVYYPNAMILAALAVEAFWLYRNAARRAAPRRESQSEAARLAAGHALFALTTIVCLLPTFLTRFVVYGSPFATGYVPISRWAWRSPYFLAVLFSADHGLFFWTPLLLLSVAGLIIFCIRDPRVGGPFLAAAVAFYLFIACYPDWDGISSFGNRFFVSLTPLFVIGLAVFLHAFVQLSSSRRAGLVVAAAALACFVAWNAGLMFQWGTHLIPARGPVAWETMADNQFRVVPGRMARKFSAYLFHRRQLMRQIEDQDVRQLHQQDARP
jgi:hypothetical protein